MNSLSLSLSFEVGNVILEIFKYSQLTSGEQVNYKIDTITYRVPFLWAKLLFEYKLTATLEEFKMKIKKWKCDTRPCRLCKKIQPNLGFVN